MRGMLTLNLSFLVQSIAIARPTIAHSATADRCACRISAPECLLWVRSGHHPSPNQCPLYPSNGQRADIGDRPRHGSVACSDLWLLSVLVMVRLAHGELVWIDATPHHTGCKRKTLGELLEWRFHSALFLACDGRLLQIELALDASARLVGNFALAQQPVDERTLGGNQVGSEFRDNGSSFEPIGRTSRQPSHTIVMPGTQNC